MKPIANILLYADFPADRNIFANAFQLARSFKAKLTLMQVAKPITPLLGLAKSIDQTDELQRSIAQDQSRKLTELAAEYSHRGVPWNVIVTIGNQAEETAQQVVKGEHDLLLATAEGLGTRFVDRLSGRVSSSLLRLCPCPVWLLKRHNKGSIGRIVAAIDATSDEATNQALNRDILGLASSIAARESATLHVVGAWNIWMEQPLRIKMGDSIIDAIAEEYEGLCSQKPGYEPAMSGEALLTWETSPGTSSEPFFELTPIYQSTPM